jgi:pyruvate dehydrogenase E2 component (dihydrolipoamide acetyltransferase)
VTITFAMPQLGLTMTEATVSEWFKKPGDMVKKDEPLLSISTDKVDMDVESTATGILQEIIVDPGHTVPVGTPLAYIETAGQDSIYPPPILSSSTLPHEDVASLALDISEAPIQLESEPVVSEREGRRELPRISPRAKRLAAQFNIDIANVKGSGPEGRIIEADLMKAADAHSSPAINPTINKRRQAIADRMMESIRTIPSFSISVEVNAEKLVSLYEGLRELIRRQAGSKLTYTDLLLRALAISLAETPQMNAVWEEGTVHQRKQIDLSLAVATDRGVVAPTLTNVDRLPLDQLVRQRTALTDRARQSSLGFADLEGGVGTLSNLGMYRVDRFEGIISKNQSFILAVGKLRNRPWVDTTLVIKPTLILNLSVDHRLTDGAAAAVFLERIAEIIENPYRILWGEHNT